MNSPSLELLFLKLFTGKALLAVPRIEKLIFLEYGRALVQSQLDQLVVEHAKLRKD